jgi:rhodanese-related sulfurtransferase/DNA-binding transcriptional ArsR family regulator
LNITHPISRSEQQPYMDRQPNKRAFKNALYEQFARIGRALANPHRLELLDLLAQGEYTVEGLAREAALPMASASQHLQSLRAAHLVAVRRDGLYAYYRLSDPQVLALWRALRLVGETHLSEIDQLVRTFLHERDQLQPIAAEELRQRMATEPLVVIDVRPVREYQAGHIPQARSLPIAELTQRLDELPADQPIVAYCRGPYCVFADEAVALLRAQGYRAYRLTVGLPDWQALGYPVVAETA